MGEKEGTDELLILFFARRHALGGAGEVLVYLPNARSFLPSTQNLPGNDKAFQVCTSPCPHRPCIESFLAASHGPHSRTTSFPAPIAPLLLPAITCRSWRVLHSLGPFPYPSVQLLRVLYLPLCTNKVRRKSRRQGPSAPKGWHGQSPCSLSALGARSFKPLFA